MNVLIRLANAVAMVCLLAVCIFGLRFACDPADLRELIRADRRGQELGRLQHAANRHLVSKYEYQLVRELIAQRCSLSEVLARLEELDREWLQELERDWPDCTREMRQFLAQQYSDPEYYRGLITNMVASFLGDRPEEKEAVFRRLEEEYEQFHAGPADAYEIPNGASNTESLKRKTTGTVYPRSRSKLGYERKCRAEQQSTPPHWSIFESEERKFC